MNRLSRRNRILQRNRILIFKLKILGETNTDEMNFNDYIIKKYDLKLKEIENKYPIVSFEID